MNGVSIPEIHVGEPVRCGGLAVIPLYPEINPFRDNAFDYLLSDEAQEAGTCVVREVSERGVVGELLVENADDRPVLFIEGEELHGAKQNRVLRSSVLVDAKSQVIVPVFCVERNRWDSSPTHLTTGSHSPPSLRHILKRSDGQAAVWRYIVAKHYSTGMCSPKENMSDAIRGCPAVVEGLRRDLQYPKGASGIAVVMNGRTIGIDLFDKADSLKKVWDRMIVLGLTLDALDVRTDDTSDPDLSVRLYKARGMRWRRVESVGLGIAYRASGDDDCQAAALVVDGVSIHLSVSMPTTT